MLDNAKKWFECSDCNEIFTIEDGTEIDGEYYCESCRDENFCTCDDCGGYVANDDTHSYTSRNSRGISYESIVCESCRNNNAECCEDCGEWFAGDIMTEYRNGYICENCRQDSYFYCEDCGRLIHENECRSNDNGVYCESCFDDIEEEENSDIQSYNYKPYYTKYGLNNEKEFFGIELEIENIEREERDFAKRNWNYYKHDGSLGSNSAEMVTMPMSYKFIKKNKSDIKNILSHLRKSGCKSYNTDTCGIHIHYTRKYLGNINIAKILKLFYENPAFILTVSQRKKKNLQDWAKCFEVLNSDGETTALKFYKDGDKGRYYAVNLSNTNTIEFRIFRGTLAFDGFMKNIHFIDSVINFVKETGYNAVNLTNYIRFINNTQINKYRELKSFLIKKNIIGESKKCA